MELRSEEPECSHLLIQKKKGGGDFPGGTVVKNPLAIAGNTVREDPTCRGATKPERHNY